MTTISSFVCFGFLPKRSAAWAEKSSVFLPFRQAFSALAKPSRAFRFACLAALAGAGGVPVVSTVARAQSGGAPVGAMSYSFPEYSTTSLGVPLLRPGVLTRVVESVSGARLTLAAMDGGSGGLPANDESYYLEVLGNVDGATLMLAGHRFEVDEVATRAAGPGAVVLEASAPLNTSPAAFIPSLVGYRVTVRPHWTLAALFGTGLNAKFNAAASVALADQVLAWNGSDFAVFYLRSGAVPQWRNIATGPTNQDQAIIPPGSGLYVRRQAGALTISVVGEVRTNRFVRAPYVGTQLLAAVFPVDLSPADLRLVAGRGLTAGTSPAVADQLLQWSGTAFDTFYLRENVVPEWRNIAMGTTDFTNARLFTSGGATLLLLRSAALGAPPAQLVQAVPFSL